MKPDIHTLSDSLLWKRFLEGDSSAYTQIYNRTVQDLFRFGLLYTSDKELIKDCIHDVFVKIHMNRAKLAPTDNIAAYLTVALKNTLFNALKKTTDSLSFDEIGEREETVDSLANNYFEIPGFVAGSPTANVVNGLKQLTFEAVVRVNRFDPLTEISSIMGIEQYCLLRFGDSGFPRQQLQFAVNEMKFPNANDGKLLQPGEWYHVAVTYDTETKAAIMYVDGKEQSRIDDYGNGEAINLGKQKKGDFMFKIGHSYGDPDDMSRQLNGEICEVRIWNVLRSQEEIYRNMYDVDPQTTGLKAYWKFNEGKGNNIAKDEKPF